MKLLASFLALGSLCGTLLGSTFSDSSSNFTFNGQVLTTSSTTNAPAENEFVTGRWARETFGSVGNVYYNSTNVSGTAFDASCFQYVGSYPSAASRSYTPNAGDYFGSVITTNRFQQISGPVLVSTYFTSTGGAGNSAYGVHPELYYTYDTNSATLLGDFEAGNQTIVHGALTNRYDWVISGFPPIVSTNTDGFWLVRRYKCSTKVGTDTLTLSLGTNGVSLVSSTPSSISFTQPAQVGANWVASGTTNSTLSGVASVYGLTVNGSNVLVYPTQLSLAHAGTVTLDLTALQTECDFTGCTGAVTFATSNLAAGHKYTLYGRNTNSVNVTPTFEAWQWPGGAPSTITASRAFVLSLSSRGTAISNVFASYAETQ